MPEPTTLTPIETEEELLAPLEEAEERSSSVIYKIRRAFAQIWRFVSDFEENHPWLFFALASTAVFIVILGVVSVFVGSDSGSDSGITPPTEETTPTISEPAVSVGAIEGIDAARLLSTPAIVEELTSPLARLERGGYITIETTNPITSLLIAVRGLEELVAVDVVAMLDRTSNRAAAFSVYYENLQDLERRAGVLYLELNRQHNRNVTDVEKIIDERESVLAQLNTLLATVGNTEEIDRLFTEYSQLTAQAARAQAQDGLLVDALRASRNPITSAQLRLAGMNANEDALVAGITIVDIDGSGLELQKSGTLEEYYDVTVDIDGTDEPAATTSRAVRTERFTPFAPGDTGSNVNIFEALPPVEVLGLEEAYSDKQKQP